MSCITCNRAFNDQRKPSCASCMQARLYDPRYRQAVALLTREKAHAHVEAIFRPGNDGVLASLPEDADWDAITQGMKKNALSKSESDTTIVQHRIQTISRKALELQAEIDSYKQHIDRQKELQSQRRQQLDEWRKQLEKQKLGKEPVQQARRKAGARLAKIHGRVVDARVFLCYQAASLAGLQKRKTSDGRSEFWLANTVLLDLRHLGRVSGASEAPPKDKSRSTASKTPPHEAYSASLEHVCRLLTVCCHYLSIRLPAEIILPSDGMTRPLIYPEKSSYKARDARPSASNTSSPSASRLIERTSGMPRPRALFLDRPVQQLAKEDPKAFQFFLEGVMLLAWDITWLCKTQGIDSVHSFEDVCAMGRNLYELFVGSSSTSAKPPLYWAPSSARTRDERHVAETANHAAALGSYSHSSTQYALHGARGLDLMRNWKLASPTVLTRLVDKLSKYITSELADQEWGILEEPEWTEGHPDERTVLVGGNASVQSQRDAAMSIMTVSPSNDDDADRIKGTSGWTKVRGRGAEG